MTAATGSRARERGARALGGNRDFRLLWIGQAASELGSSISTLALPMLVLALSGSAALAGLLATVSFLAMWLGQLPGGYIADMFDRRRVMLLCDLGRAVLVGLAAAAVLTATRPTVILPIVVGASTFLWMAFSAAQMQAVRMIVPAAQLPEAISVNQARGYAVDLIGPLLAGWLFAIDHAAPLIVDVATFLVSLACVWLIRTTLTSDNQPTMRRLLPDLGHGWSLLWRHPFLRAKTAYSMMTNFAVSMLLFVLILGTAGGVLVGVGISVAAAAGLLGSIIAPAVSRRVPMRPLLVSVALIRCVALLLAAALGGGTALVAVLVAVLLLGPMTSAALTSAQMVLVPGEALGRAGGSSGFLASALQPLAPLSAGFLVQYADRTSAQVVLAAAFATVAAIAAAMPGFSRHATTPPAGVPE